MRKQLPPIIAYFPKLTVALLMKTWQMLKECLTQQHLRIAAGLPCISTDLLDSINKKVLNIALVLLSKPTTLFHYFLLCSLFVLNNQMGWFSVCMTICSFQTSPVNNFSKKSVYKQLLDKTVFSQCTTACLLNSGIFQYNICAFFHTFLFYFNLLFPLGVDLCLITGFGVVIQYVLKAQREQSFQGNPFQTF